MSVGRDDNDDIPVTNAPPLVTEASVEQPTELVQILSRLIEVEERQTADSRRMEETLARQHQQILFQEQLRQQSEAHAQALVQQQTQMAQMFTLISGCIGHCTALPGHRTPAPAC